MHYIRNTVLILHADGPGNMRFIVEDLINHAYSLEVSSPGLERPLRNKADFQRFAGKKARIKLRDVVAEQKVFIGLIGASDDEGIELLLEDGTKRRFLMEQIRKARLSL